MRRCKNCQVTIKDNTLVCPLCDSVLEGQLEEDFEPMYPNVKNKARVLLWIMRIYTFLAVVAEIALVIINYFTYRGMWWSAISGIAILYLYVTLRFSILKNRGYRRVMLVQVIGATLLSVGIDFIVGYRGWSVNYVVPSAVLLLDLTIVVLIFVNLRYWQSYILLQIFTVLCSVGLLIFCIRGIIRHPVVSIVAMSVSAVLLLGTLILGGRSAVEELRRRFHV